MMNTIKNLAKSRIRYNRSRTVLTAAAIMFTTMLLMCIGTSAVGLSDINLQQALADGNSHASLKGLTKEQIDVLQNHRDVEAIEVSEIFATVEEGKTKGVLNYTQSVKDGIYHGTGNLIEGHEAENADEICGPQSFFEHMGVEPVIGNKITISFRPQGKGRIETREFTICGIVSQTDMTKLKISDTRIMYNASISEALIKEYIPEEERVYTANIRVTGEDNRSYDEIKDIIQKMAADIGCSERMVSLDHKYLMAVTDMGTETMLIAAIIALMVIVFSGLVIYSIYYVGVITDVQEIGKLKALGASDRQIRRLLLTEGLHVSLFAIPCGLLPGFLIPYLALPAVHRAVTEASIGVWNIDRIHMFSPSVLLLVTAAILLTVCLSLLKPMRMAGKISPVEAIRYQESSGRRKMRKGNKNVNVFRLSVANLSRNRKRTIITMLTMGLSCVLFMSLAGTLNSMSAEDIARRNIEKGDFRLSLRYAYNDQEYPENNLDVLVTQNPFGSALIESIGQMDGVKKVERSGRVPISSDYPSELFANGERTSLSWFDRDEEKKIKESRIAGSIDYDSMAEENGAIFNSFFYEEYNIHPGDVIPITVYDGDHSFSMDIKVTAITLGLDSPFLLPKDAYDRLNLQYDSTTSIYISVDKNQYDEIKTALTGIVQAEEHFEMYSMDEELSVGKISVALTKYPMYAVLVMVAVIGFMNLVNTMVTSVITRKRELGILQAVGLSERQLTKMLSGEGMVFTAGTLLASVSLGNLAGYLIFCQAKKIDFMSITRYHYPLAETIGLAVLLTAGQLAVTGYIRRQLGKVSMIDTIRENE